MYYLKYLPMTGCTWRKLRAQEQTVLDSCNTVLACTPLVQEEFQAQTTTPVACITNGFDEEDFASPAPVPDGFFNLTHTGLFAADGNPLLLWKVLGQMAAEVTGFRQALRLRLVGKVDAEVLQAIATEGLADNVVAPGPCNHAAAVREQRSASVLLLPLRQDPQYRPILPGKLFEYLPYTVNEITDPEELVIDAYGPYILGDSDGASPSECEEPVTAGDILSYSDKYGGGGQKGMSGASRLLPAPISEELREKIRSLAVAAFMAIGCSGVARIDFLMDKDTGEVWVNELNTIPGSLAFYLFRPLGVSYTAMLSKMIDLALKRERMRDELSFSFKTDILKGQRGFKSGAKGSKGAKI